MPDSAIARRLRGRAGSGNRLKPEVRFRQVVKISLTTPARVVTPGLEGLFEQSGERHPERLLRGRGGSLASPAVTDQIRLRTARATNDTWGNGAGLPEPPSLDWLAPESGLRWLNVGCGNGAFTEDNSRAVRPRPKRNSRSLAHGPCGSRSSGRPTPWRCLLAKPALRSTLVMPLVIFSSPNRPGGRRRNRRAWSVRQPRSHYAWDMSGGGFPYTAVQLSTQPWALRLRRPRALAHPGWKSVRELWTEAGLEAVDTHEITSATNVRRLTTTGPPVFEGPSVSPTLAGIASEESQPLKVQARGAPPPTTAASVIVPPANAVKGRAGIRTLEAGEFREDVSDNERVVRASRMTQASSPGGGVLAGWPSTCSAAQ